MRIARVWLMMLMLAGAALLPTTLRAADDVQTTNTHVTSEQGGEANDDALLKGPSESLITALTTLVIFVVLVSVLGKAAWGPIVKGLAAREAKIRGDITAAEAARKQAEQALADYNAKIANAQEQIRTMLSNAAADGEKLATSIRMKAQSEAEEIKERATKDIDAAREAALREIYEKTAELSTSIAEKIIRRNLNANDQQELVRQSLEQLHSVA